jgi:hypothetical protein
VNVNLNVAVPVVVALVERAPRPQPLCPLPPIRYDDRFEEEPMKLSAPKHGTWLIALIVGALGVVVHWHFVHIAVVAPYAVFLIAGAWALLLVATLMKGL